MIPVLFKKNEQQFRSYGLGPIHDIVSPKVTRERNGQYLLYFQYPQDAEFADVFEEDMRIKSDAGVRTKWQTFEISRVVRKEGQLIEVFAKHISQSLLKDALNPSVNVRSLNAQQALRIWNNNRIGDEEFDVWSDISTTNSTNWNIQDVSNAFEALAGVQGSILDVWGGEYEFDNKLIRLHKEMGRKSPVPLEYGRNITGLEQDQQEDNVYTSVYPFATYTAEGDNQPKTVTLPERYIDGKYLEFHNKRKIQVVDFSGEFEHDDIPTVDRLRTLTENCLNANEIGLPHENLKVEYIDLSKTLDYQEFQTMEEVELNDRLPIFYPKFRITNENAKVVVINYDPVKEENISIELGVIGQSFRTVTTGGLGSRLDRVEKQQDATNTYIVNAKGNRIWFETPDENMEHKIGDTWFEKNGPYDRIRVWNGNQWETIIDTEDVDKNAKAIAEQQEEIEEARQVADDAVNEINEAIKNAGFTSLDDTLQNISGIASGVKSELDIAIENAGFKSLDDTLQNMNYIAADAEQNAQQAIANASNAYGLAQTSISEAQTAQANSLTALGKADNALDGVSSLNVRVDDVEAELELKADNTFMNEDGTLTTLSNAITFNAHRFSSDMSRIESRVESLAGEINLVILRDAFENSRLNPGTMYPTPDSAGPGYQTMRELIAVQGGEKLAMSKETSPSGFNQFRFNFYDDTGAYLTGEISTLNQYIVTVPQNATKMWVSYPTGSKPQIVRGTIFVPYRPNLADQMTTDEMVLFRNEYDEYADRTERRLTAIDSTGGSLDVLGNEIIKSADRVTTDMTALINTKVGDDEFTEFYQNEYLETAREVSRKISLTDIKPGERNLLKDSGIEKRAGASDIRVGRWGIVENIEHGEEVTLVWEGYSNGKSSMIFNWVGQHSVEKAVTSGGANEGTTIHSVTFDWKNADDNVTHLTLNKQPYSSNYNLGVKWVKLVKGNITSLDWVPAYEDTQEQISHIETEWTQTFDTFSQTVSGIDGRVTEQKQTIDSISGTVSGHGSRISTVEQTASGLQSTVADKADQSQVTQLAAGLQSTVGKLTDFIYNSTFEDGSSLGWEGITVESSDPNSPTKHYAALRQRDAYFGSFMPVEVGEELSFSITAWNISSNPQPFTFGVAYYDKDKNLVSRYKAIITSEPLVKKTHTGKWTVSSSAVYVRPWVNIGAYSSFTSWFFTNPKISRVATNSKITQLEDSVTTTINGIGGRIVTQQQSIDGLSSTIANVKKDVDGKATVTQFNTLERTVDGTITRVGNAEGKITQIETNVSGIQSTVASKANQSQVTQLSNVWQASVGKLTDFIYNSTFEDGSSLGWEGITVETGYTHSPSKYYGAIRQRDAYFGDLIPIEGGERLNFSIHAWNFTVSPQPFKFGVRYYDKDKNPISWYTAIQSSKGNVLEKHTASWTASASARYVRPWVQISAYSNFTPWFFSQPQISRVPTNAQISMLENNINVRVQKGDLLSQINIEADRQLFQSGKMLFDAENVIFTGKAWIPSSVIGDLEADKITSGTLDAGQITVVNLDALSITTNRAQMVQAGFNAINSNLSVDGNSLTYTHLNGSQTILSAGGLYHREGGTNYQSHYLMEVGTETIDTHDLPITGGRLVTLPKVFRGKPFKVVISIADVLSYELTNYQQFAIQRLVAFPAKDSINHANGTFRIFGYARMMNTNTREVFHSRIQVQYTVIA